MDSDEVFVVSFLISCACTLTFFLLSSDSHHFSSLAGSQLWQTPVHRVSTLHVISNRVTLGPDSHIGGSIGCQIKSDPYVLLHYSMAVAEVSIKHENDEEKCGFFYARELNQCSRDESGCLVWETGDNDKIYKMLMQGVYITSFINPVGKLEC